MSVFINKENGLGSAPTDTHRALQMWLVHNLDKKLNGQYVVGMEYTVRNGRQERTPDVSVWKGIERKKDGEVKFVSPLLTIEITRTKQNDEDAAQSISDVFAMNNTVQESFIYNYKEDTWIRYKRTDDGKVEEKATSYSSLFQLYLNKLL